MMKQGHAFHRAGDTPPPPPAMPDAACLGHELGEEAWTPTIAGLPTTPLAQAVCHTCAERGPCLTYGARYATAGIWGGQIVGFFGLPGGDPRGRPNCPRCGTPYTRAPSGQRRCVPCKAAADRRHRQRQEDQIG